MVLVAQEAPVHTTAGSLSDGSDIRINGLVYRLVLISGEQTSLPLPAQLPEPDVQALRATLPLFSEIAQLLTHANEKLLDPLDGLTNRGLWILLQARSMPSEFKNALTPFVFACIKNGTNIVTERGCVIVPPAPRAEFERQIQELDEEARTAIDWKRWLDHLFCPVPKVGQGFYLFETDLDFSRFEASLGPSYQTTRSELDQLFQRASTAPGTMDRASWDAIDRLSQALLDHQRAALDEALAREPKYTREVATRVRVRAESDGVLRFTATHFAVEFCEALSACAQLLDKAKQLLPSRCEQLKQVVEELALWCREREPDERWAESRAGWLAADQAQSILDLNFTAEEKVSRVGSKGSLQFLLCAFEPVPLAIASAYEAVRRDARQRNLNVLFLRQLIVGGGASNWTLAGEKLPDPGGRPLYKVMTFTNTVKASHVRGNGPLIVQATEWPKEQLERMGDAVALHVLLHEYGHTLGDFSEFLGDLGSSVEETNAEASAIYQASRLAPDYLRVGVIYGACWTPVLRAMQGPTEAHSHSDIVLFGEYEARGAVRVVEHEGRKLVRAEDCEKTASIAFEMAMRMRLWEAGLSLEEHDALVEAFDAKDRGQDERIHQRAMMRRQQLTEAERRQMQARVLEQVRAYFSSERLERAARPLREVIDTLPKYQALSVVASDRRVAKLFSCPDTSGD